MLTSLIRSCIIVVFLVFILRFMGKRQIGQLQPSELVITILFSQIASFPMQDNDVPLMHTLAVLALLAALELIFSLIGMKSRRLRRLFDGSPVAVIRDGRVQQAALRSLRYTLDDLLEALRAKNVFELADVEYAAVETNGTLSVLLFPDKRTACAADVGRRNPDTGVPTLLVADGKPLEDGLREAGMSQKELRRLLEKKKVRAEDVFLLTVDKQNGLLLIRKEARS